MELHNPNFPLNLNIHPSSPITYQQHSAEYVKNYSFQAQELAIRKYGIAGRVWEASYAMTFYIHPSSGFEFDPPLIDGSRNSEKITIVELGSGSGMVAFSLAKLLKPGYDRLIVTDLPEVCPLLQANLDAANLPTGSLSTNGKLVSVRPLSWGNHHDAVALVSEHFTEQSAQHSVVPVTHIICSDLVYFPELLAPLLRSLLHLTSLLPRESTPSLIISYKIRSLAKESSFWSAFGLWFKFRPVLIRCRSSNSEWQRFGSDLDDTILLFVAHRREESFDWEIPALDDELLGGVGAHGNDSRKGDDTFENLLIMAIQQG
ncbi:hypothetical protein BYT27DRAFT_7261022 [Phlegmacium glaucopus]|nr:hypothetical protein BYT27DRAFT_7261022 [Phlegmacium glaucopus]